MTALLMFFHNFKIDEEKVVPENAYFYIKEHSTNEVFKNENE